MENDRKDYTDKEVILAQEREAKEFECIKCHSKHQLMMVGEDVQCTQCWSPSEKVKELMTTVLCDIEYKDRTEYCKEHSVPIPVYALILEGEL